MAVLNPIYIEPNMTARTKIIKRQKFFEYSFWYCLVKPDGVDRIFPFAKRDIIVYGVRDMSQKKLTGCLIRFARNSHVYQAPKLLLVQLGKRKRCLVYKRIYFGIFWRLK